MNHRQQQRKSSGILSGFPRGASLAGGGAAGLGRGTDTTDRNGIFAYGTLEAEKWIQRWKTGAPASTTAGINKTISVMAKRSDDRDAPGARDALASQLGIVDLIVSMNLQRAPASGPYAIPTGVYWVFSMNAQDLPALAGMRWFTDVRVPGSAGGDNRGGENGSVQQAGFSFDQATPWLIAAAGVGVFYTYMKSR